MLDASPMARAASNAITAQARDRITRTRESCRINRPRHSGNAECYRAGTVGNTELFGQQPSGLIRASRAASRHLLLSRELPPNRMIEGDALPASPQVVRASAPGGDGRRADVDALVAAQ